MTSTPTGGRRGRHIGPVGSLVAHERRFVHPLVGVVGDKVDVVLAEVGGAHPVFRRQDEVLGGDYLALGFWFLDPGRPRERPLELLVHKRFQAGEVLDDELVVDVAAVEHAEVCPNDLVEDDSLEEAVRQLLVRHHAHRRIGQGAKLHHEALHAVLGHPFNDHLGQREQEPAVEGAVLRPAGEEITAAQPLIAALTVAASVRSPFTISSFSCVIPSLAGSRHSARTDAPASRNAGTTALPHSPDAPKITYLLPLTDGIVACGWYLCRKWG
eukprot:CAMPEP_0115055214 /NCGR_PEP_ID=MMETSP0227-20121206/4528_1 /TAXON_ID=89957 /ORGANISM="Polarella glacialis, Strain CCMP 1383" /LENGTH=269 /DNA_ID=CAMNT_0002439781 /DNA_START=315 /DNA_END=1121 /DNA_ORIENTATION=-